MFPQNRSLQDVMNQVNITLPAEDVQALSKSTVNIKEVGGWCVGPDLLFFKLTSVNDVIRWQILLDKSQPFPSNPPPPPEKSNLIQRKIREENYTEVNKNKQNVIDKF